MLNKMLLLLSGLLLSFSVVAEDLMTIYNQVLQSDPALRAAEAGHRATMTTRDQAQALYLPNASLSANVAENSQDNSTTTTDFSETGYTLSISQPVLRYDAIVQKRQAELGIKQSASELTLVQQDAMLRSAERYFGVLSAHANLDFARSEKKAIAKQLEQAQKRFEVGLIAITDVHEAQSAYDLAIAQEIIAENELSSATEALTEITGQPPTGLARLSGALPLIRPEPNNMDQWTETAMQQNLSLQAGQLNTRIVKESIELQRSGHWPNVDIVASRNYTDAAGGVFARETTTDSIALQLQVPLYSGGLTTAQTQEAVELYSQAQHQLDQQRRTVLRQTRDAFRGVISGISQVQALKQATVSSRSALETTQAGFEVGTRTIVDVLLAQRSLLRAIRDYTQAKHQYIVNILRLKQAAGTLAVADLEYFNRWLGGP